jgi:hypothetical protein
VGRERGLRCVYLCKEHKRNAVAFASNAIFVAQMEVTEVHSRHLAPNLERSFQICLARTFRGRLEPRIQARNSKTKTREIKSKKNNNVWASHCV